ncbi:LCP family protein [Nocardia jiangxiensis]|uniref:LCP family protein n=1 Tax=Nocardia jiangxiensis TaxID=282685 RepID=A0ABW6RW52_9NOCA
MRRVPPNGPGARRPMPGGRGEPPRIEPNQVMYRDGREQPLAWSRGGPQSPPPPPPRDRGPRQGSDRGWAPTQRPVPYREGPPPSPPVSPTRRQEPAPRQPRVRRRRHWGRWLLALLLVLIITPIAAGIYLDSSLHRIDALGAYSGRVGQTSGTNWLLTGSDSREGMTQAQEQQLSTGDEADAGGERSDTIMLVHIPQSGPTTIVSLPRDSYVPIPGHGRDKLNAAFAVGGPKLLVQTVETATGLHIDHFAKIGFGGFANMVDAVGGIDMCLPNAIDDPKAGLNLPAGCQHLSGPQALGFVRTRATPRADLDRMNNQRMFLAALLKKATSASTLANPFKLWPLATGVTGTLQVDNGDHIWDLGRLAWALHANTVATTVPIGGFETVDGSGSVLLWDKTQASQFFADLAADKTIPDDLLTK